MTAPQRALRVPGWMTVDEAAPRMGVSRMTVYRMVHAGELPAKRVRRSLRLPVDAVDEYLRNADVVSNAAEMAR